MGNKLELKCNSANYEYPGKLNGVWRLDADEERFVEAIVSPEVPGKLYPYLISRIAPNDKVRDATTENLRVRVKNMNRFLSSNCQEVVDALQENIEVERIRIAYSHDTVSTSWALTNINDQSTADITLNHTIGETIDINKHFLTQNNQSAIGMVSLSRRDQRKVFVVTKNIVRSFPKVLTKNTPLRGLYGNI